LNLCKDQKVIAWIDIFGDGHEIFYGAPFIHWWKITAFSNARHTEENWLPNANLGIVRAIDHILTLPQLTIDNTFVNVGIIHSGRTYNHTPASGWFSLDIRAPSKNIINEIEIEVRNILDITEKQTNIRFQIEPISILDGGQIPGARESSLVKLVEDVCLDLGYKPILSSRGCCNMIIPISHGRLAIGVHGERGGKRGTSEEYASIPAMIRTAKFIAMLARYF